MMSTLLKLGLSGYDVKPHFGAFQCEYLLQNPLFLRKNEPTFDHSGGGGVHGKAYWLIAYYANPIISTGLLTASATTPTPCALLHII